MGKICVDGECVDQWKTIAAGTFKMGSPEPKQKCWGDHETQHDVTLTRRFEIMRTEVTQRKYEATMGYNPSDFSSCGPDCPVEDVSWHEAVAYCNALSKQAELTQCYTCTGSGKSITCTVASEYAHGAIYGCPGFRLPTEAEWEYAYRAGETAAFHSGYNGCEIDDPDLDRIAWYIHNAKERPHVVGGKDANAWGLYDMAGNVWEWCHDGVEQDLGSAPVTDPWFESSDGLHACRGGAFDGFHFDLRAAARGQCGPAFPDDHVGFRCCRHLP